MDVDGTEPVPLAREEWRDAADRRYPPHLDARFLDRWRRGRVEWGVTFVRNRRRRDQNRREAAGDQRVQLFTQVRRLGPGDRGLLEVLRTEVGGHDLAGAFEPTAGTPCHAPVHPHEDRTAGSNTVVAAVGRGSRTRPAPASAEELTAAFSYLRDPWLRHWVAETVDLKGVPYRVEGHLAARVYAAPGAPPAMLLAEFGVHPADQDGEAGPLLLAAMLDEAIRLGVATVLAPAPGATVAQVLRAYGFETGAQPSLALRL